ncbi:MAG TPA: hypothetical protein VHL52_00240 [Acidimicrobiia bacterium]|nr:hypothetical protein [Acidimicrobiia bacterium]
MDPGTYEIRVISGDLVLATSSFEVVDPANAGGLVSGTSPLVGLLALAVLGLGWQAARTIRNSTPYGPTTGLVPGWRHFRRWMGNTWERLASRS